MRILVENWLQPTDLGSGDLYYESFVYRNYKKPKYFSAVHHFSLK